MPDELDLRNRLPRKGLENLRVLNVGVGAGSSSLARQLPYFPFKEITLVDVHQPYLDGAACRHWDAGRVKFVKANIRNFDVSGFDWVFFFDILEHLPKEDSLRVLRSVKGHVLVFIPLEEEFRKNVFGVEVQDHLSLWKEEDFKELGFFTERLHFFHQEGDVRFDALWAVK